MDADCLDPAYAKSSEKYPPTPPSVHCITFPEVSRTRVLHAGYTRGQWFMRLRVIYSEIYLYFENVQAEYWLVIMCSK